MSGEPRPYSSHLKISKVGMPEIEPRICWLEKKRIPTKTMEISTS